MSAAFPPSNDPPAGDSRRMGPFLLGEQIGRGGMGIVYRATYSKTGQEVAIKFLPAEHSDNPRVLARFERELAILQKLRHPHIVRCYGGGRYRDQLYFAMELVEGGSLAEVLRRRGKLSWDQTIEYGKQICAALEHAHAAGIIHRDVKPANLLVTKEGKLKLTDFGLARDSAATALTQQGSAQGTFAYMSPEIIRGEPPVSHKTDLYSLGCVLFQMLTGQTPFTADSPAKLFYKHIEEQPPRVSSLALDCPMWLETLVDQLLEKNPEKRPRDAGMVKTALIEVERKVKMQESMFSHSMSGAPSALSVERDLSEVRKMLGTKRRKKKKPEVATPLYERPWFLAAALAAVVALVVWAIWPMSEEALYRRAADAVASGDEALQLERDGYLAAYIERFPEGPHADEVRRWSDEFEMERAEKRMHNRARLGQPAKSEGERLYGAALRYERFGDRLTAYERYRAMLELLKDTPDDAPYLNLARRQLAAMGDAPSTDRQQIVAQALADADTLYRQGETVAAAQKWQAIVDLYGTNRELAPLVEQARMKLSDPTADAPIVPQSDSDDANAGGEGEAP